MDDDRTRLLQMLRDRAADIPAAPVVPPRTVVRARRRIARNAVVSVAVAGLIAAGGWALLGSLSGLRDHDRTAPGHSPVHPDAVAACAAADLRASSALGGAAGSVVGSIEVTNTGAGPCTLEGRPTIALAGSDGALSPDVVDAPPQWQVDGAEAPPGWPTVTLRPGEVAAIRVAWSNLCPQLTGTVRWQVTVPGGGGGVEVSGETSAPPCNGPTEPSTLQVGPFEPGGAGSS